MTISRHLLLLRGFLAIVLTVSVQHQAECRLTPSEIHNLLQEMGKIGKITLDLMCKPRLAVAGVVSRNVLAQQNARQIRFLLNNLERRRLIIANTRFPRRRTANILRRIPMRVTRLYRPLVFY